MYEADVDNPDEQILQLTKPCFLNKCTNKHARLQGLSHTIKQFLFSGKSPNYVHHVLSCSHLLAPSQNVQNGHQLKYLCKYLPIIITFPICTVQIIVFGGITSCNISADAEIIFPFFSCRTFESCFVTTNYGLCFQTS